MGCRTAFVVLSVKGEGRPGEVAVTSGTAPAWSGRMAALPGGRWSHGAKLVAAHDSFTLLEVLDGLWTRMRAELPDARYRQVAATFMELTDAAANPACAVRRRPAR